MLPTEEERSRIQEAQAANPDLPLGSAEQFLLTLASISELPARLKLWAFKLDFENSEKVWPYERFYSASCVRVCVYERGKLMIQASFLFTRARASQSESALRFFVDRASLGSLVENYISPLAEACVSAPEISFESGEVRVGEE